MLLSYFMISVAQIRAARAMLSLKQQELADMAGISLATLNNIERGVQSDPKVSTMRAIQLALESCGIAFSDDPYGGVGVYYTPKHTSDAAVILIVDDSKADRLMYANWLSKVSGKSYRIVQADNARSGVEAFEEHHPDCVILDFMLYGSDGFQLLAALKRGHAVLPPIIFVTGMHRDMLQESAVQAGVHAYLNKQHMSRQDLCDAVEAALASVASAPAIWARG